MKKLFPAVVTTLAIAAGGAGLYFMQKSGGPRAAGALTAADYLPAETLVLLACPDPARSLENWRTTDLYKIWTEPQVQAFAAKPLSKLPSNPQVDSIRTQLAALDPKSLFIAVTKVDEGNNHPHIVGGFQFKGTKAELESALADAKKQLRETYNSAKADLIQHQGHTIETLTAADGNEFAATYLGDWYLVANDVVLLKATIDRVEHRAPAGEVSLSKEGDFLAVGGKLPAYETLVFARPQIFLDRVYALAVAGGQALDPNTLAESKKVRAIGATTAIENGKFRDTIYTYAPGLKQDNARLQMDSLPLSSPETLFYLASAIQWPEKLNLPATSTEDGGGTSAVRALLAGLEAQGITMDAVRAALNPEVGLQLTWPAASLQPSLLASIAVRDQTGARKLVEQLTSAPLPDAAWVPRQDKDRTYYALSSSMLGKLEPTLTVTDKHVLLGLDAPEVREAAQRENANGANITVSETYKSVSGLVDKPNVSYAYLDTKGLFERTYGLLRPYAMIGAAFLPAQNLEYVDPSKLPDTETISKHLSPSVLSQTLDKDGMKLESVGSVSFGQGGAVIGGATAIVAASFFAKNSPSQFFPGLLPGSSGAPNPHTTPRPGPMRRTVVPPTPAPDEAATPVPEPSASPSGGDGK